MNRQRRREILLGLNIITCIANRLRQRMVADPLARAMTDRPPDFECLLMVDQRLGKIALVERSNAQIMQRVGLTAPVTVLAAGRQGALIVVLGRIKVALLAVDRPQTIQNLNKRLEVAIRSR